MKLGEAVIMVREVAGVNIATHSDQKIKMAMGWALDTLAAKAAEASGPRLLYEWLLDISADTKTYRLPDEVRVVKEIWNDDHTPPSGYTRIPYPAQSQVELPQFAAHSAPIGRRVWWQTNRIIHIRPRPSAGLPAKLRVAGYGRPSIPTLADMDMPVPFEAEPWFFVKSATRLIPPAQGVEALVTALQDVEEDLERWLWQHSASVPPGPIEGGVS